MQLSTQPSFRLSHPPGVAPASEVDLDSHVQTAQCSHWKSPEHLLTQVPPHTDMLPGSHLALVAPLPEAEAPV